VWLFRRGNRLLCRIIIGYAWRARAGLLQLLEELTKRFGPTRWFLIGVAAQPGKHSLDSFLSKLVCACFAFPGGKDFIQATYDGAVIIAAFDFQFNEFLKLFDG
jgi:hypothetical protein